MKNLPDACVAQSINADPPHSGMATHRAPPPVMEPAAEAGAQPVPVKVDSVHAAVVVFSEQVNLYERELVSPGIETVLKQEP